MAPFFVALSLRLMDSPASRSYICVTLDTRRIHHGQPERYSLHFS